MGTVTMQEKYEAADAGWKSCIEDLRKAGEMYTALEAELTALRDSNIKEVNKERMDFNKVSAERLEFLRQLTAAEQRAKELQEALEKPCTDEELTPHCLGKKYFLTEVIDKVLAVRIAALAQPRTGSHEPQIHPHDGLCIQCRQTEKDH